jgi:hypothetical protein
MGGPRTHWEHERTSASITNETKKRRMTMMMDSSS